MQPQKFHDVETVELCLPAHLLFLMIEECAKAGIRTRKDVLHHLNMAAVAPLANLDEFSISRMAKKTDDTARALLRELTLNNPLDGLFTCAMFCLLLVDEGLLFDVKNQAILVSLMLMEDARDEKKDANGEGAVMSLQERRWKRAAHKMLGRARLYGMYSRYVR